MTGPKKPFKPPVYRKVKPPKPRPPKPPQEAEEVYRPLTASEELAAMANAAGMAQAPEPEPVKLSWWQRLKAAWAANLRD